jgi:hypothetical protein
MTRAALMMVGAAIAGELASRQAKATVLHMAAMLALLAARG